MRPILVFVSALLLMLTACHRTGERAPATSRGSVNDLSFQLEACRKEHERQVSSAEVQTLRAELRRYAGLADQDASRQADMQRAMDVYSQGVCLIHGIFTLNERRDEQLVPATDAEGNPLRLEYLGSGFLVSESGHIVTNRHVAEPWWNNETVTPLLQRGLEPAFMQLTATFPSHAPITVDPATIHVSNEVDLAVFTASVRDIPVLPLSDRDPTEFRGQRLMLMGYPTGLSALIARAEPDIVAEALAEATDATTLIDALSKRKAITAVITHGTLNDATTHKLIYDAVTTSGGSGGPVFGPDGEVIGVNYAILRDFQGSNFGVPIRFVRPLLP
ncbi:MAG: trypsin-like peptidase domain-containing protein [Planctomycetes bacterium]|nr:trypsin-like peptidase domain-containing protein [Planctomycetota bacterium]MBI3833424.1 trypsin-like peptidase domain-containing protein [Planctomycetota bacterium]